MIAALVLAFQYQICTNLGSISVLVIAHGGACHAI
jgi:hypothetical protein